MGCFLGCFGGAANNSRRRSSNQKNKVIPRDQRNRGGPNPLQSTIAAQETEPIIEAQSINVIQEIRDETEEQSGSCSRKKVTFDSTVTTYEHVSLVHQSIDSLPEKEKGDCLAGNSTQSSLISGDDSVTSSVGSYPPNHRYQNCRDSDDEAEEFDDSDLEDEDDEDLDDDDDDCREDNCNEIIGEEVPLESSVITTKSMESRNGASPVRAAAESPFKAAQEPIGLARDHPVLLPVENLAQWKATKLKRTLPLKPPSKENSDEHIEPPRVSFTHDQTFKKMNQEIAVDASLSNWLGSPQKIPANNTRGLETIPSEQSTSKSPNSARSFEDRPILGALTIDQLKQISASSSPRKSPSQNPDEMPIIGTVGTYWSHDSSVKDAGSASSFKGIPNTTSKYREDKRVNWHSTPFETRLERALNQGKA